MVIPSVITTPLIMEAMLPIAIMVTRLMDLLVGAAVITGVVWAGAVVMAVSEGDILVVDVKAAGAEIMVASEEDILGVDVKAAGAEIMVASEEDILGVDVKAAGAEIMVASEEDILGVDVKAGAGGTVGADNGGVIRYHQSAALSSSRLCRNYYEGLLPALISGQNHPAKTINC